MKKTLTRTQSERLFALGVSERRASEKVYGKGICRNRFRIEDLLSLIPQFERGDFVMWRGKDFWEAGSIYPDNCWKFVVRRRELIDALYEVVLICIENRLIKL